MDNANIENAEEDHEFTADELKEKGNSCVRNENYNEAVKFYSQAIKLCPKDAILFSNRSLAFLKLKQYYYANHDADTVILLNPSWPKGHFRKAEVLSAVGHYDSALLCYGRAMHLQPGDRNIITAAQKVATLSKQQTLFESRLPWVGAGVGIIIGVIISLSDHLLTKSPTLKHPSLMVLLVIVISCIGYTIARTIRYYKRLQKKGLLEKPVNLINEFKVEEEEPEDVETEPQTSRSRYTKAQARMRFKKGKS